MIGMEIKVTKIDFELQMLLWGYAAEGELPRDPMTYWLETRRQHGHDGLFDLTEEYFQTTTLNGERPPWWHALLPMTIACFRRGITHPAEAA